MVVVVVVIVVIVVVLFVVVLFAVVVVVSIIALVAHCLDTRTMHVLFHGVLRNDHLVRPFSILFPASSFIMIIPTVMLTSTGNSADVAHQ